ncbi:hypothetical protein HD597_009486 [Nonomuraea thailandensis]|uniref:HEAT repeat domain-containing protein n=1 Tax=Nonomuraea thailandensis TaxID=1188745 RepID=A0A9X2GNZ2_9ACTN|nr:hypothetical protein [Nonomuraea thailandensis]MCP2362466.1 hypothetical protein [Nonomuraea thailandensis]
MTDADPKVRAHTAQNPLTTLDGHRLLANDRQAIWPSTPAAVLRVLAEDPHPEVKSQAQARLR